MRFHRPSPVGRLSWPLLVLAFVWALAWSPAPARACGVDGMEVLPPQPTVADPVTLRITGVCTELNAPGPATWTRTGSLIRLDSAVVLSGIPSPSKPFEQLVDLGHLPAGSYRAEYFLEVFAAPSTAGEALEVPDAVVEFEVLDAASVPTLDLRLLILLALLLASGALWTLRRA